MYSGWFLGPFDMSSFSEYFLTFWNNKTFQVYFVCLLPQPFFQAALITFTGEWYLEIKIWAFTVLITTEVSLPPDSLSVNNQEIYVYTYTFVCEYVFIHARM